MWRRILPVARSLPVLIAAGVFGLYLLFGFFLVDPLARKLLPWAGERMLASRLTAQRVEFNPLTLELRVQGLQLAEPSGALLAGFEQLYANLDVAGLARWAWLIREVDLQRPQLRVEVRRGGALNWGPLIAKLREGQAQPSERMVRLLIDHIRIADGDVVYIDANREGEPFQSSLKPLGVQLDAISTLPQDRGGHTISARMPDQGATLRWKGELALNPLVAQGDLEVEGARLDRMMRAVNHGLDAQASGTLGTTLHYRFALLRQAGKADIPSLSITGAQAQLRDFALGPRGGAPLLQLPQAQLQDASFDLLRRELVVGSLVLEGGKVSARSDAQGVLDWQALFARRAARATPEAPSASSNGVEAAPWKFDIRAIHLAGWTARWTDEAYATPLGAAAEGFELTASLSGEVGTTATWSVGPVNAAVGPLQLLSGTEPVAQLQRVSLTNAVVKLPQNQVRVESLVLAGARAAVEMDKDRHLRWTEILRKGTARAPETAAPAAGAARPDVQFSRVSVEDAELRFVDASTPTPVTLELTEGRLALKDVGLDLQRAIPLEAAFTVKQGGRFQAKGSVVPGKPSGQLDVQLAGLTLKPFAPYVNQFARLYLHTGVVGTRGKLLVAPAGAGTALTFKGGFAVDDLAITEEDTGEAFLGWKQLSSDSASFSLAPDRLHVKELVAQDPFGKIIIFEDQTLNLQRLQRVQPQEAAAPATPAGGSEFPVAVDRLRIVDANVEFADLSLKPQFGTRMHDLSGVVTGLTNDPASAAQVELDGKVDDYGSARVRGSIQPFRATQYTDLTLAFRNLEMTRLTPYSGKFAGRRIESGRLSVDLEYKIKERQLAGANKFVVTRLRLGEAVDSPGAMKLPLDLAIAVLEDTNGVIDLDLPVSGSLDDPQFSYGAIIWKAIANVLTKIVTAPFRALGVLLGVDNADKLEAVAFDPGRSVLLPPEQEKLKVLADALAKRPALTVTIEPGYDPQADRRALQEAAMRREAAEVAGRKLAPGEDPGPVDVNDYKIQTWLEDRYSARVGKDEYGKLRASFQDKNAGAVARVMDTQLVERLGRRMKERDTGPPSAFHAELLERLTREQQVADEALVALAQARAQAMRESVVKLGLAQERVAVGSPAPHAAKDKQVASGLALGAALKPAPPAPPTAAAPRGSAGG